jgi:DNA-binding response OmpR family regulator
VVLLDMMMAGIGGMESLRRIKAARAETSVVMITAIDDRDVARKALAAGASDYLTKPLSLDLLDSALALHVTGPRPAAPSAPVELVAVAAPSPGARRTPFVRT